MVDLGFFTSIYQSLVDSLKTLIGPGISYPNGTLTIVVVAIIYATVSSIATRALVDVNSMRRKMAELKEWQSALLKAQRAKDQKQLEKLNKRKQAMNSLQMDVQKSNFKPMLVTFVPLIIFYYLFWGVFDYNNMVVAYSPIDLPFIGTNFVFWTFYLLCSFGIVGFMGRIFNLHSAPD